MLGSCCKFVSTDPTKDPDRQCMAYGFSKSHGGDKKCLRGEFDADGIRIDEHMEGTRCIGLKQYSKSGDTTDTVELGICSKVCTSPTAPHTSTSECPSEPQAPKRDIFKYAQTCVSSVDARSLFQDAYSGDPTTPENFCSSSASAAAGVLSYTPPGTPGGICPAPATGGQGFPDTLRAGNIIYGAFKTLYDACNGGTDDTPCRQFAYLFAMFTEVNSLDIICDLADTVEKHATLGGQHCYEALKEYLQKPAHSSNEYKVCRTATDSCVLSSPLSNADVGSSVLTWDQEIGTCQPAPAS